jgi:predicted MFS family arabinose efflux permease
MPSFLSRIDWRSRETLLILMAIAMPLSFSTWQALLNNFALEKASFDSVQIGFLQSLREVPGFLSFTIVFVLLVFREQPLTLFSLLLLGIGTAVTGFFPSIIGLYLTTVLMSTGFHYFEALHQSLALQWTEKSTAPIVFGRIVGARSFAALISFGLIYLALDYGQVEMKWVYLFGGGVSVLIAIYCWTVFPRFEAKADQNKKIVLRKRYWLWYVLVFMSGARRQIFVVFAGFLMVEKFGFSAAQISLMFMVNMVATIYLAPKIGKLIVRFGERRALILEYSGLVLVFTSYALATEAWMGVVLYILDHIFFAMAIAIKTYFQKIADPKDIASSSGVSFTISHIVAVVIPAAFGFLYLASSSYVFLAGAAMAGVSLVFSLMIPNDPKEGNETTFARTLVKPAPAE